VEMLKFRAGDRNAREILLSGTLYTAEEALRLGLIERISAPEKLAEEARAAARRFAQKDQQAFTSIKKLLRAPVARAMAAAEEDSIREFVEIWYSENTRKMLKDIKIYE
jgi:methylglutaconyl-CoA hydratase